MFGEDQFNFEGHKVRVLIVPHYRDGYHVLIEPKHFPPNPLGTIGFGANPHRRKVGAHEHYEHARRHALRVLAKFDK